MIRRSTRVSLSIIGLLLTLVLGAGGAGSQSYPDPAKDVITSDATESDSEADDDDDDDENVVGSMEPIEEILVTANRREENIQDVAMSVTALSGSFLEETGVTEFGEMQKFTPNLQIIPQTDSRSTSVRIRGIGSTGNNAGIDPSVAIFLDGVYQGRAGMSVGDLLDIQAIEILKGPQGTLYGKNTAAGAIKVTTRRPTYETTGSAEFVAASYRDFEGRFALNIPLVDETVATRLTGYGVGREGFEHNGAPGKDYEDINDTTKWGLRSKTLWDVTDTISLLLSGDYSQQNDKCCVPDVVAYGEPIPGVTFLPTATEIAAALDPPVTLPEADPTDRVVDADTDPSNKVAVGGVSLEATFDINDYSLTSLTAYRNYKSDSVFDGDFSQLPVITWETEVALDQVSQEFRLVSPGGDFVDTISGLYFYYSSMQTDDILTFREEYMDIAFGASDPQFNIGDNKHETLNIAGYGDATFNLSELWNGSMPVSFTGGIRVGWEQKKRDGSQVAEGALGNLETPISGPDQYCQQERSVTDVSGRAILKVHPTEEIMFYGSVANGHKSGGFNQLRTVDAANNCDVTEFDDESSMNYEIGLRTQWLDRMVTANITGFYTDYDDFQAQIFDGLGIYVDNAGEFESYGFEADMTVVPLENWINVLSVGYNITNYREYPEGPCIGPPDPPLGCVQDLAGRPLDNAPKLTITTFSSYHDEVPWFNADWFVQMDYQYMSSRYLNTALDPQLKADAINVLGLRAGLRDPDEIWELALWMKNVTDENFFAVGFDVPTMGGKATFLAPPRQYGMTLRAKF